MEEEFDVSVSQEIWISSNRWGEVGIVAESKPEMPGISLLIAGFGHFWEDDFTRSVAFFWRIGFLEIIFQIFRGKKEIIVLVSFEEYTFFFEEIIEEFLVFWRRFFMDSGEKWNFSSFAPFCDLFIGKNHISLYEFMHLIGSSFCGWEWISSGIKRKIYFGALEGDFSLFFSSFLNGFEEVICYSDTFFCSCIHEISFLKIRKKSVISVPDSALNHAFCYFSFENNSSWIDPHNERKCSFFCMGIEATNIIREFFREHGNHKLRKIYACSSMECLLIYGSFGANIMRYISDMDSYENITIEILGKWESIIEVFRITSIDGECMPVGKINSFGRIVRKKSKERNFYVVFPRKTECIFCLK